MTKIINLVATMSLAGCAGAQSTGPTIPAAATPPTASRDATEPRSGYADANGLHYYYEVHGAARDGRTPLLVLHGGLGSIDMFGPVLPLLAAEREVIAVDLHGHGRTALGDREIDYADIGDDLAAILETLGYEQVDVMGYSMGGGIALRLAIQHPARVRRLVIASAPFAQHGFYPEMLPMQAAVGAAMADAMRETPMYRSYAAVAPHPEDFPRLLDRMGAWMRRPYDWSAEVRGLRMPVLLVFGDHDMMRPEHVVAFFQLLGGGQRDAGWNREHVSQSRLAIIPDATHYELFMSPRLAETVLPFLGGASDNPRWSEQVAAAE